MFLIHEPETKWQLSVIISHGSNAEAIIKCIFKFIYTLNKNISNFFFYILIIELIEKFLAGFWYGTDCYKYASSLRINHTIFLYILHLHFIQYYVTIYIT